MGDILRIKTKTKAQLEDFISNYPCRWSEQGGFLIENRLGNIDHFLPIPNHSETPKNRYEIANRNRAIEIAQALADSKRSGKVKAFWHNHPNPCIMSGADLSASGSYFPNLIFVTISPLDEYYHNYIWYACKGVRPVEIVFV